MDRTGRSVSMGPAADSRGKVSVSALIAGISSLLMLRCPIQPDYGPVIPGGLPGPRSTLGSGGLRRPLFGGRARVNQRSAGIFEVCADEPLELLQLRGV